MRCLIACLVLLITAAHAELELGIDVLLETKPQPLLTGKRVGLITNHTAINRDGQWTLELLYQRARAGEFILQAIFAPEHGLRGLVHAGEHVKDEHWNEIPVYSLHGKTRRPSAKMLDGLDIVIFDIQDIGSRSYTYLSSMCYCMEECAKRSIDFAVLDRPNPMGGQIVDGPLLDKQWRSFVGYIDVPYCHGMTMGELAQFFNKEYKVGCHLTVVPMKGWQRGMLWPDTGLTWVPTSPHIPEANTPLFYPATGILGELGIVNIGVGYTLPFKLVGAPWIDADRLALALNQQNFPGVRFHPFHYEPFYGTYSKQSCHGVMIEVLDATSYLPVATQYLIIGMIKSLYPSEFAKGLKTVAKRKEMFCKVNGTDEVYNIMVQNRFIVWKLRDVHASRRKAFLKKRARYLRYPT